MFPYFLIYFQVLILLEIERRIEGYDIGCADVQPIQNGLPNSITSTQIGIGGVPQIYIRQTQMLI
jgi:hypothetical protein